MAHHAEPMDIDESDFDNKENTYQHTNVLPRTPCTEKGYEELDVSELNMKLRYSMTPTASPMSKSMSHCLDNRYNTSTDESLNNTIINEYENNLTRSLNSTLNKTEVKTPKVPLQALPTDLTDSSRSTSVLRPLESTATTTDITITVSNENEIDNLSFPSSSSSMTHTPEATTPTKEIPKHDGGSPILRGLKSVLNIFRSSQSPVPPGDEETKTSAVTTPADMPLPESKPQAIASTPKNEIVKETSISRRNSPLKESIVFNDDLEKELQWSDDSTIVFSSEKIPIRKLFFQEKPFRPAISNEDADSTVEFMDVSYNDLSVRDKTLNGTVNKSNVNELPESDGEFVDCESTFTHNKEDFNEVIEKNDQDVPEKELVENNVVINEPFILETTRDIINMIDSSQAVVEGDLGKQLDFSTTDIVNQLSDLINEETEGDVTLVENIDTKDSKLSDVQLECVENQVTSPVDYMTVKNNSALAVAEQVCITNDDLTIAAATCSNACATDLESIDTKFSSAIFETNTLNVTEVSPTPNDDDEKSGSPPEITNETVVGYPSPVDIPLPNEDDIHEINDNVPDDLVHNKLQDKAMPASISQNALMTALNISIAEARDDNKSIENEVNTCPPSLLSSDVPLLNTANQEKTDILPHESMTAVNDPDISTSKNNLVNDTVTMSITKTVEIPNVGIDSETIKDNITSASRLSSSNIPLPTLDDLVKADNLSIETVALSTDIVQENAPEKPDIIPIETSTPKVDLINQDNFIKTEIVSDEVNTSEVVANAPPMDLIIPGEGDLHMEISFTDPCNDKFSESLTMDVSMADATKPEHAINPIEICRESVENTTPIVQPNIAEIGTGKNSSQVQVQIDSMADATKPEHAINPIEICSESLENKTPIVHPNIAEIGTGENSNQVQVQISDDIKIETENSNKDIVVGSMSMTVKNKSKTLDVSNENVNDSTDLKSYGDVDPVLNIVFQKCEKTTSIEIPAAEKVANVAKCETSHALKANEVTDGVSVIVSDSDAPTTINMNTVSPSKSKEEEILNEKSAYSENETTAEFPQNLDLPLNIDSSQIVENASIYEQNVDEEIVVSESNSPFISMSAEEVLDLDMKKEDFEKVENALSSKPKEAPSPPGSPKIVSKGYNFNFDDIDNINPFAAKTKIRMSPPPGSSPTSSLVTQNMNKTEVVEPLKSDNNINRRKSMPVRKKPLKAKRHFNSTFDSTENTSSKTTLPKEDYIDLKITPKTETKEEVTATESPTPEINQNESNRVESPTHNANQDAVEMTQDETAEQNQPEALTIPRLDDSREDTNVKSIYTINTDVNNEIKLVEDCIISDGCKPDNTSSSEQSTYFSAGTSSTELGESKNVFNLPELDDFNPFVTKSKIRQSPPRELDVENPFATKNKIKSSPETSIIVAQKDPNSTVTIDDETKSKEASHNMSTCSGSSKNSDEKDATVHEVHTEDEDTLEGPFLEAEVGNDGDKMTEFTDDKVDMVELANLNPQENEDNAEMFIDAEAFEFLMNQNKSDEVAYSGKESLFLKFDPLFARRVTLEGVSAALNQIERKQSTPKKTPKYSPSKETEDLSFNIPVAGPSDLNNTREVKSYMPEKSDDVNLTVSKPMMAVTPAVNPVVTPRKSLTPNKSNRLSMTFTSPAMAVIDRLLSLSANNSPSTGIDTTVTHVDRTHSEADLALTQLRELLAEKEIHVYNLRCESKELKDRLTTLETQMKALEAESAERLKKVNELNENLAEKTKQNRNMAAVVEEYERTIASLISETEQDKKRFAEERNQLIRDRDEQTAHLASMEVSFNDLHSKYEKSKQVIIGYKTNEEAYIKSIQEFEENLSKMHTNYELLKQHATSKLNHANQELEKINKAHEAEVLKFNAMLKRKELHITSLEESLAQKTKANEELTAICDELINKVG